MEEPENFYHQQHPSTFFISSAQLHSRFSSFGCLLLALACSDYSLAPAQQPCHDAIPTNLTNKDFELYFPLPSFPFCLNSAALYLFYWDKSLDWVLCSVVQQQVPRLGSRIPIQFM